MIYDPVMGFKMCYKYISWIKWIISQSPQKKKPWTCEACSITKTKTTSNSTTVSDLEFAKWFYVV